MDPANDAIFDQPDLFPVADADLEVATTYRVTVTRTGKQWTATATDLPGGHTIQAQGANWVEVRRNIGGLIVDLLKDEPGTIGLRVIPADPEAAAALAAVIEARQARMLAEQAERDAVRHAARLLIAQGWTTRDAGSAMRLSHQRISQIVSAATP
ncbi:hypothetical protein [Nonomuraea sp. NPDC049028]|uniref:hypothetical protein n=1 Tax=Nonomuraea sp. NPDC049028 TaxID=3364348 RepID=UPI003722BDD2